MGRYIGVEDGCSSFDVKHGFFMVTFHVVDEDLGYYREDAFFEDLGGAVEAGGEINHLLD